MKQGSIRQFAKVISFGSLLAISSMAMAEPSIHQIYETANSGDIARAESMMREVITAHPESAKAHYVYADLLAKAGKISAARDELLKAEKIQPDLSFAKTEAVNSLRSKLYGGAAPAAAHSSSGSSIWTWIGLAALIGAAVFFFRALFRRPQFPPAYAANGQVPANGPQGPYPQGGYGPQGGMMGGGMGSGILGGLATGAAVGAGIVAGEALMHNILDDKPNHGEGGYAPQPDVAQNSNYDMGGNDFGLNDTSSWDNSSSFSESDSFGGGDSGDWT